MKTYEIGSTGIRISEQVFGCWAIGGTYFTGAEDAKSVEAIRYGIERGMNTLDTAPAYGNGHSEQVVAEAIRGMDRGDVVISTKLPRKLLAKPDVRPACELSLKNLNTDYIDIYFIHWPTHKGDPIEETMGELMKLKEEGKIRCIGLSNFSRAQIEEARQYGEVDIVQPCYNMLWRLIDHDSRQYCIDNNIAIINYSTLAQGLLSGKFSKDTVFPPEDGRSHASLFQQPYLSQAVDTVDLFRPYADKYGVTPAQLAIRFCMQTPGITAPIVGAKNIAQVESNLGACDFEISAEDYAALDRISMEFSDSLPDFHSFFWIERKVI